MIGHGCRVRVAFELGDPQLFSGLGIEGPEAVIDGGANEHQSSCGGDGTAEVIDSGWGNPLGGQLIHDPQRNLPGQLTRLQIDGIEISPGRLLAGVMLFIPKARVCSPLAAADVGLRRAFRCFAHEAHGAHFTDVHEEIIQGGIERRA